MRKITQDAIRAFRNAENFKRGNTQVIIRERMLGSQRLLKLHGNTIAEMWEGELYITSAGWKTVTTKERLNGFPNVHIQQKDFEWYLNGELWDGSNKVVN
tara:strand:- start:484 stop:783 length:300 start_codon:yes stop_codon:yes gene_type:complete